MWRSFAVLALISSMFVAATSTSVGAQQTEPTVADTARLLGHLWADGSYDNGVWDATGPSGGSDLIQRLVNVHGGTWINRTQLIFTLPAPYDWAEWKGSLPNDDSRTREAVQHPNFLAALLEGEGSTAGLVYDQSSCCTAGFTNGRLVELRDLLLDRGFSTATLTMFGDADSGRVNIGASEFAELRQSHEFICPSNGTHIRVPGAENFAAYGSIRWLGSDSAYSDVVRTDCVDGRAVTQISAPVGDCVVTSEGNGSLRLTWSFQRGLATIRRDGNFVTSVSAMNYVFVDAPAPGSHTYTVRVTSDGLFSDSACGSESTAASFQAPPTAGTLCDGKVVTVMGTGEADEIRATDNVDVIHGYGGADRIAGLKGNDTICGGDGDDTIRGGRGSDTLRGGRGDDTVHGGRGGDTLRGGRGSDTLRGNQGKDTVWGGQSTDELYGGNGIDFIQILNLDTVDGGPGIDGCLYETAPAEAVSSCETTLTQATAPAFIAALDQ